MTKRTAEREEGVALRSTNGALEGSARGESSLVFSLQALTAASPAELPHEDTPPQSGNIDLTRLAEVRGVRVAPALLDAQPVLAPDEPTSAAEPLVKRTSRLGLAAGIGVGVASLAIAAVIWASREPVAPAVAPPLVASVAERENDPAPTAATPSPVASVSPAPTPPMAGPDRARRPAKVRPIPPADQTVAETAAEPAVPAPEATQTAKPPPPNPCGCMPNDLKCNMECVVKGS